MKSRLTRFSKKKSHQPVKRWIKPALYGLFAFLLITSFLAVGAGVGIVSAMVKDEPVRDKGDFEKALNSLFENSYAYFANEDENGNPIRIGAFRNEGDVRKLIKSVNDVNPYLVDAFISVEDRDFYKHHGIVPRSILRAAYQQITNADVTTGGSTITQQLVRRVILEDFDKDLARKSKEIVLAIRLDSLLDKNQILVYYMNSVYFGKGANNQNLYGVQAAANGIFGVDAKDLNLAQSAFLAGMVQRPNAYNPFGDPDNLKRGLNRMKLVLSEMLENKKITEDQYQEALEFDIEKSLAKPTPDSNGYANYPFIMYALEKEAAEILMKQDGLDIEQLSEEGKYRSTLQQYIERIQTQGYHVYSTIDKKMYDAVNKEATKHLTFHPRKYGEFEDHEQLGAVILDNRTGAVLSFVSSSDHERNQKDHAFDALNQPGSAIKPLIVYGPAIDQKVVSPDTKVLDEKLARGDGSGYYQNANQKYHGPVSIREALKWSYNIPAIKVFNHMGHDKGFDYLRKLKIPPHPNDGESAAIGGQTKGYSVARMTAAFSTFGNQGKYNDPYMVKKITNADGEVIYEHESKPETVFSPQTAYQVTDMLREVVRGGTGVYIGSRINGYDIAGKTGTTSEDRDLWFIGYTPQITLGVWSGYDYNFPMSHNDKFSKQAWVNIFKAAQKAAPHYFDKNARFENPGGLFKGIECLECDRIKKHQEDKEKRDKQKDRDADKPDDPAQENPDDGTQPPDIVLPPDDDPSDGGRDDEEPDDQNGEEPDHQDGNQPDQNPPPRQREEN